MKSLKNLGGFIPTLFDLPEVWKINAEKHGPYWNWVMLPLYFTTIFFFLVPFTILVLISIAVSTKPK